MFKGPFFGIGICPLRRVDEPSARVVNVRQSHEGRPPVDILRVKSDCPKKFFGLLFEPFTQFELGLFVDRTGPDPFFAASKSERKSIGSKFGSRSFNSANLFG
jgi:hypothetical protein